MIYTNVYTNSNYTQKRKIDYIQIYKHLPTYIALHVAEYDDTTKKNMQRVLEELLEYHYMEWIEYNTPGGWAGHNEIDWSS